MTRACVSLTLNFEQLQVFHPERYNVLRSTNSKTVQLVRFLYTAQRSMAGKEWNNRM